MEELSMEEVKMFLQQIKMPLLKEGECRLNYLNRAIYQFCEFLPFQNVFLLSTPQNERRSLSWEEIKSQIFNGEGGICMILNVFFYRLLQALGMEAHLVNSAFRQIADNHSLIIVKNILKEGDSFAVDVGSGYLMQAIPLDFEDKSVIYSDSFCKYFLQWDSSKANIIKYKLTKNQQIEHVNSFNLIPIYNLSELAFQNHIFTDQTKSPFHTSLRIIRFPTTGAICILNQTFMQEDSNHEMQNISDLNTVESFLECIKQKFSMLNLQSAKLAYFHLFPPQK